MPDVSNIVISDGTVTIDNGNTDITNIDPNDVVTTNLNQASALLAGAVVASTAILATVSGVNLGNGLGLYTSNGVLNDVTYLNFKSLNAGAGIALTQDDLNIYITSSEYSNVSYLALTEVGASSIVPMGIQYANAASKLEFVQAPNTANQILTYNGTTFVWELPIEPTITITGTGITVTGSPLTGTGSIGLSLAASGVTAGLYTGATIQVDSYGRITQASSVNYSKIVNAISLSTGSPILSGITPDQTTIQFKTIINGPGINSTSTANDLTLGLSETGVSASTYTNPTIAVDAYGRITTAANGTSYAPLSSPSFSGTPTAPTAATNDNSNTIATTAFVTTAVSNSFVSTHLTGTPTAPTAGNGTNTTQIATTAFVTAATNNLLVSPAFSGTPTAPTPTTGDTSSKIATTAFVSTATSLLAPLASPTFTGVPVAPTASNGTNTTQIATTAFVSNATYALAATVAPIMDGTAAVGTSLLFARQDHIHPSDTSRAPLASPNFTGSPTAPTPTTGDNTTNIATTRFVNLEITNAFISPTFTGVPLAPTANPGTNSTQIATTAFVTAAISSNDTSYAPLASPNLTGTPTAPTPTPGNSSTEIATTAFVGTAINNLGTMSVQNATGVAITGGSINGASIGASVPYTGKFTTLAASSTATFNGTLTANSTATFTSSAAFQSTATAITPTVGDNSTNIATTAFVTTANANAIAPLAPLASPTFTGVPLVPTAAYGTSTQQIASTAFVTSETSQMVIAGSGAPSSNVGLNSQYYIDTVGHVIYGPKASGAWPGSGTQLGSGGSGSGITFTASTSAPLNPNLGDQWYDENEDILYTRISDGNSSLWLDISTAGDSDVGPENGYTVSTLPTPQSSLMGYRSFVTDALNPTFLGSLTGGGSTICPVFCNGTNWVAG